MRGRTHEGERSGRSGTASGPRPPPLMGSRVPGDLVLEVRGISKRFPGVLALDHVDLDVRAGEVHVVLGENGAGKSTLMKILSGAYRKDDGEILIDGQPVEIQNARHAQDLGIAIIYQTFNQVPHLSVSENILLGRERTRLGLIDYEDLYHRAQLELDRIGLRVDLRARVMTLSVAQRQMIEIAKALSLKARVVIMDEPTSALTEREVETLFGIIDNLRGENVGVIYISHRLEEVKRVGDRVTVLRDGRRIGTLGATEADIPTMIRMMVGRDLTFAAIDRQSRGGAELLRVEHLVRWGVLHDISFSVRRGEIVGFFGLVGAGRTELARVGVDRIDGGQIAIDGRVVRIDSPGAAVRQGLGFLVEDRLGLGLALSLTVAQNMTLPSLAHFDRLGILRLGAERRAVDEFIQALDIQTPSPDHPIRQLSGGNQQKVALARWLMARSRILLLDEPTQGIDVGAKEEVHRLMIEFTRGRQGAVVLISSDLPEILRMSDRILVMREGRIIAEVAHDQATQELIMEYAAGTRRV
jgi:ribose transport system ATP-binding protein